MEDQAQFQNSMSLTQLMSSQLLRKITQLLLSVSVFSFIFSCSAWYYPFKDQMLSQAVDKNCIFLICNGILVLLAKTSGFNSRTFKTIEDGEALLLEMEDSFLDKQVSLEAMKPSENALKAEEEAEEEEEETPTGLLIKEEAPSGLLIKEEEEAPSGLPIQEEEEEEEAPSGLPLLEGEERGTAGNSGFPDEPLVEGGGGGTAGNNDFPDDLLIEGEEEGTAGNNGFPDELEGQEEAMSTEELNKKFDEFIRRMKEEFRIGACRQQLVMA